MAVAVAVAVLRVSLELVELAPVLVVLVLALLALLAEELVPPEDLPVRQRALEPGPAAA